MVCLGLFGLVSSTCPNQKGILQESVYSNVGFYVFVYVFSLEITILSSLAGLQDIIKKHTLFNQVANNIPGMFGSSILSALLTNKFIPPH